jgi:hypothetical protein
MGLLSRYYVAINKRKKGDLPLLSSLSSILPYRDSTLSLERQDETGQGRNPKPL